MSQRFEYGTACIKDFSVTTKADSQGRAVSTLVELKGEAVRPSPRFWSSLHTRFGFTSNIFKYFTHAEVFDRISRVAASDKVRFCIERNAKSETGTLLAVTSPTAASITHDDLMGLVTRAGGEATRYHNGVVTTEHSPRLNPEFQVAGDSFHNRFILETPIDGYGRPSVYLSMLRLICANGLVGFSPTFRSELPQGKGENGVAFVLERVLDGF
ncbi:MAG: hypothetical protein K2W96_13285, partial [Gemmataceae bacterium]|nr:hypothetical protein [Gemmataceae bacterium]